ncbi:MAG TPA: hypothetical protein VJN96_19140 [Vicinamibacterales bacterium]|nr:hypothetical protein [Vicinamibacterales bacterium]
MARIRTHVLVLVVALVGSLGVALTAQTQNLADTPQGKVVLAFYKAAHAGDLAAVSKLVTEESMKETKTIPDFAGMLKAMTPVANPTIDKVTVTGNTAKVDASYKDGATSATDHWSLVKVGADWKMDMAKKK